MINIKIDKYTLSADPNQYIIFETKKVNEGKHKGEDYETNYSFYPTIDGALNGLLRKRLKDSNATTLIELKNDLNRIKNELYQLFDETIDMERIKK